MKRRLLALCGALALVLSLGGCWQDELDEPDAGQLLIDALEDPTPRKSR